MGKPAARLTDMHTCPMVTPGTPPIPHVGGPIVGPCVPKVLIGFLPAAVVGDKCICVGPPDTIAMGSPTVLIGNKMAARLGDPTMHGGVIVVGFPTVLIGESGSGGAGGGGAAASPSSQTPPAITSDLPGACLVDGDYLVGKGILIRGTPEFQRKAIEAYSRLYSTPSGKKLIDGISDSGKKVIVLDARDEEVNAKYGTNTCAGRNGGDSTISWDPDEHNLRGFTTDDGQPLPTGSDIILGHETVHAYHNATGTHANGPRDKYPGQGGDGSSRGEERATVGTGGTSIVDPEGNTVSVTDYSDSSPTENSLRRELGMPERKTYYPTNWPGGPPW